LAEQALVRRKPPAFASSSPTSFVAVKVHFGRKPAGIGGAGCTATFKLCATMIILLNIFNFNIL
jgi:hypothetical protein